MRKLLYFVTSTYGGLADYAREQSAALADCGLELEVLCAPAFCGRPEAAGRRLERLPDPPPAGSGGGRLARAARFLRLTIRQHRELARSVREGGHRHVLLAAYGEYFAPLWAGPLRRLARDGVRFGAVVHDPVRDAVLGPASWHRRSVRAAYSFLDTAFVHEQVVLDTGGPMPRLRTVVIPHGPYRFPDSGLTASAARRQLGLPDGPPLLLAFGHIRDNKNLDLLLRALVEVPEVHLVVAGQELSSGQKPVAFYRRLAEELGLADRCHWFVRYVQPEEAAVFFRAADLVALTYAAGFRSASGVLNASIHFRRPCLASSGPSPLKTLVTKYDLGLWVPPDDTDALAAGLRQLLAGGPAPRWNDYLRDNSWERNARIVADTLFAK